MEDKKETEKLTRVSMHSIKNILGDRQQISFFSDKIQHLEQDNEANIPDGIDRFGIKLNDIQFRVLEALLKGFSDSNYEGNLTPKTPQEVAEERFSGKVPIGYKYISKIPRIRIKQSKICELAGAAKDMFAKIEVLKALDFLGSKQFCCYYRRLAFDNKGVPRKDSKGNWEKEEVITVDTLFSIKKIFSKKATLDYYEIQPSSIFLDQVEGFFILFPPMWQSQAKKLIGKSKSSIYTYRFFIFLRYQFEIKRRSGQVNSKGVVSLKWTPNEIAEAIRIPPSVYIRKKKQRDQILEESYKEGKKQGYLENYIRHEHVDELVFNPKNYPDPENKTNCDSNLLNASSEQAESLLSFFVESLKKLDPHYKISSLKQTNSWTNDFKELLKTRSYEDIKLLISWTSQHKYWGAQLNNPKKILEQFSMAWIDFQRSGPQAGELLEKRHKDLVEQKLGNVLKLLSRKKSYSSGDCMVEVLNKTVEFSVAGSHTMVSIEYKDPKFEQKLDESIKRFGFGINNEANLKT